MATIAQTVEHDELELFIDHERPISAAALADLINQVVAVARSGHFGGPHCEIDIVGLSTGSIRIRFRISAEWIGVLIDMGLLAVAIAALFSGKSEHGVSATIADLIANSDVVSVVVTTRTEVIRLQREELAPPPPPYSGPDDILLEPDIYSERQILPVEPPPKRSPYLWSDRGTEDFIEEQAGKARPVFLNGRLKRDPLTFTSDEGCTLRVKMRDGVKPRRWDRRVRIHAFVKRDADGLWLDVLQTEPAAPKPK